MCNKRERGIRLTRWRRKKVAKLSEAQNHRCAYCGCDCYLVVENRDGGVNISPPKGMRKNQRATLEHLIPQSSEIQTNKDENLVMACKLCNSIRSDVDPLVFYRTIRDKDYRNSKNNKLMAPNKRTRKSMKSMRRRNRKSERRAEVIAGGDDEKKQKLIAKEQRTWALACTLVTYWPSEVIEKVIIQLETPWEIRKFGRSHKIEQIAERLAA